MFISFLYSFVTGPGDPAHVFVGVTWPRFLSGGVFGGGDEGGSNGEERRGCIVWLIGQYILSSLILVLFRPLRLQTDVTRLRLRLLGIMVPFLLLCEKNISIRHGGGVLYHQYHHQRTASHSSNASSFQLHELLCNLRDCILTGYLGRSAVRMCIDGLASVVAASPSSPLSSRTFPHRLVAATIALVWHSRTTRWPGPSRPLAARNSFLQRLERLWLT